MLERPELNCLLTSRLLVCSTLLLLRLAGLVLGEASVVLRQGVVHRLELPDGQLTPGVLGTPSRLQKIFR